PTHHTSTDSLPDALPISRHDEVRHDDRRPESRDLLQRFFTVGGRVCVKAPGADELGQSDARGRIVLDDQDAFGGNPGTIFWLFGDRKSTRLNSSHVASSY